MIVPIRCWTCGKPVADKYDEFLSLTSQGKPVAEALDSLSIDRYCCRRMFLAQADLSSEILPYARY